MDVDAPHGVLRAFADLKVSRMDRIERHNLTDIVVMPSAPPSAGPTTGRRSIFSAGPRSTSHAVVTIDAMGCPKEIAETIMDNSGNYVLQLKGNRGGLHAETVTLFDECLRDDCLGIEHTTARTINKGRGRIEWRTICATEDVRWFAERDKWKGLRRLVRVR